MKRKWSVRQVPGEEPIVLTVGGEEVRFSVEGLKYFIDLLKEELKYERVACIYCHRPFRRQRKAGNRRVVCEDEKCLKLHRLGYEKPVRIEDMDTGAPTTNTADIIYHGRPQ